MTTTALPRAQVRAELQLAYLRKLLITLIPIISAGVLVLSQAVNAGTIISGVTWWQVVVAIAGAAVVYVPSNALVKAGGGLVAALAGVVAAALTHGGISLAELLQILVTFFVWATAAVVPNGEHPDVVLGEVISSTDTTPGFPTQRLSQ